MAKTRSVRATKASPKKTRRSRGDQPQEVQCNIEPLVARRNTEPITPKTENQKRYLSALKSFALTFGVGPAGTGKTYVAGAYAAQLLEARTVDKIIVTRPAVEAGESLGFLPGELDEKYAPFLQPLREVLAERLGAGQVDYLLKSGRIEAVPLAYMRGRTFKNAFVILDEAQNTTPKQMKLFLTRIGEGCRVVVDGDIKQSDLGTKISGLEDAVKRLSHIPSVKVINFTRNDIVRSGLVAEVAAAYENPAPGMGLDVL
jgi:phosphate starvation-inducible PhoH-like protein